ncbi:hypothetical protein [Sphingomonas dokdonensis]|uniref:Uncharacterized protein n=1 Tax=Sphingomonas dokdonensis TaxID=344880 RepID=A0A245ZCZ8_9SPHN|nr:hypothetical protein [Sphingomonas dokdonensis]OWK27574.1 hypothetical protein SPDO_32570 [Sphingomonas dokdonensis]
MTTKTKRTPAPAGGPSAPAAAIAAPDAQSAPETAEADPSLAAEGTAPTATAAAEPTAPPAEPPLPAADEKPSSEQEQASEHEITEARVLVAFDEHDVDDIVTAPVEVIEQLAIAGRVDPHPDAIAFAKSLLDA